MRNCRDFLVFEILANNIIVALASETGAPQLFPPLKWPSNTTLSLVRTQKRCTLRLDNIISTAQCLFKQLYSHFPCLRLFHLLDPRLFPAVAPLILSRHTIQTTLV